MDAINACIKNNHTNRIISLLASLDTSKHELNKIIIDVITRVTIPYNIHYINFYKNIHLLLLSNNTFKKYKQVLNILHESVNTLLWISPLLNTLPNLQRLNADKKYILMGYIILAIDIKCNINNAALALAIEDFSIADIKNLYTIPALYHAMVSSTNPMPLLDYAAIKQTIHKTIQAEVAHDIQPPYTPRSCVIFVTHMSKSASDMYATNPIINALKRNNIDIDVYYIFNSDNKIGNDIQYTASTKCHKRYTYAFIVSHLEYFPNAAIANRIAKYQLGVLGHILSSGTHELDYFITPEWDIVENYTETMLRMPGMACGIPPYKKISNEYDKSQSCKIFVIANGAKLTQNLGPMLQKIEAATNGHFNIMFGSTNNDYRITKARRNIHIKPFVKSYTIYHNNRDAYYEALETSRFALIPFPYTSYISLMDMLFASTPVVCHMDKSRNISQCAARLLMLFGLDEMITYTKQEYINYAVKLAYDDIYYNNLVAKIKSVDYAQIIEQHNLEFEDAFTSWLSNHT